MVQVWWVNYVSLQIYYTLQKFKHWSAFGKVTSKNVMATCLT